MKILICDDENEYIQDIKNHVSMFMNEHNEDVRFFEYSNGKMLLNCKEHFDIAFLDVEINGVNGIDIGKALKKVNENIVIFVVTAYEKYMDEAMDLNVFRFLQKPVNPERLYAGLEKAIRTIDSSLVNVTLNDRDKNIVSISTNDIAYVEIDGRKTKVVTKAKTYFSQKNITYWRDKLVASFFCHPHKSFIVNIKYISKCEKDMITIINGDRIPIAYRNQSEFSKYFVNYFSRG